MDLDKENSIYDSMYEFDAPKYVDFDNTIPVDDTIFDRKVVGDMESKRTPLRVITTNKVSPTDVRSPVIVKKDLAVTKASSNDASSAAAITVPKKIQSPPRPVKVEAPSQTENVKHNGSAVESQQVNAPTRAATPPTKGHNTNRSSGKQQLPKSTIKVRVPSPVPTVNKKTDRSRGDTLPHSAAKPKPYPTPNTKPLSFLTGKGLPPKANSAGRPRSPVRRSTNAETAKPKTLRARTCSAPDIERLSRPTKLTPAKSSEDLQVEKVNAEKKALQSLKQQNSKALARLHRLSSSESVDQENKVEAPKPPTLAKKPVNNKAKPTPTKPAPTVPQTPKLRTSMRTRSSSAPSAEQLDSLKSKPFKANPVNRKIFNAQLGVKMKEHVPVTEPLPIHFATDDRLKKKPSSPERLPVEVVRAKSPPKFTKVFKPVLEHKHTKAVPCRVLEKDEERRQRRELMLRQLQEQERKMREFRANPLPQPQASALPAKVEIPTTAIQPFNLRIDERGSKQQEKFKAKLEEENAKRLQDMTVTARPATVLKKQPFVPKKMPSNTTEPFNIQLYSEKRAEERQQYEAEQRQMEAERLRQMEIARKKQEIKDQLELLRLRKETVFKPAPIRHYKPINIQRSSKPPTAPVSPVFRSGKRPTTSSSAAD